VSRAAETAHSSRLKELAGLLNECELLERRRLTSKIEAKMACFSFIEGWYNPVGLHSPLGYRSPMAYEAAMEAVTTEP
jgi:transposase InsO family protein